MLTFSLKLNEHDVYTAHKPLHYISLNMATVEMSVNKWENKVTFITYLKK